MFGLEATGELDADTKRMMSLPRCGVKDSPKVFAMNSYGNYNVVDKTNNLIPAQAYGNEYYETRTKTHKYNSFYLRQKLIQISIYKLS